MPRVKGYTRRGGKVKPHTRKAPKTTRKPKSKKTRKPRQPSLF